MTKKEIVEILSNHSAYVDSRQGNAINEKYFHKVAEDILKMLNKRKNIENKFCRTKKMYIFAPVETID